MFQPDVLFVDRLAPDTLTLVLKLLDRNNLVAGVEEVYDPPKSGGAAILTNKTNVKIKSLKSTRYTF